MSYVPDCKTLLNTMDIAVALVDPASLDIVFENTRFETRFSPDDVGSRDICCRFPSVDMERAASRLGRNRPYSFDVNVGEGARVRTISFCVRPYAPGKGEDRDLWVFEGTDITKTRQAEYMLDSYSRLSEKSARDARREKDRVEKLLLNIMPRTVYQEMRDYGVTTPQKFESASVLMLDFVGFTSMAISRDPEALISELNDIFTAFDRIVEMFDCERIKTIGDAYMAVSGIPEHNTDHASNLARAVLRMRRYLKRRNTTHQVQWTARFGIATGPAIGSIVGIQKYVYDIFGPAVNMASRLEALSQEMEICISAETARQIDIDFTLEDLGVQSLKGMGDENVFRLVGETQELALDARMMPDFADAVEAQGREIGSKG